MRTQKQLIFRQSILEVLQESGCPFLKEHQAARQLTQEPETLRDAPEADRPGWGFTRTRRRVPCLATWTTFLMEDVC
jgi:hypothetical protein